MAYTCKRILACDRALAERTADAYSYDAYRPGAWAATAAMLRQRGFTEDEAEEVLRSKIMRWAGDSSEARYGRYTSRDVARFLDRCYPTREAVRALLGM